MSTNDEKCKECHGTGEVAETCWECGGSGKVDVDCEACDGTGEAAPEVNAPATP